MNPRKAFFACLERSPPALFEAALWIAAEHDPAVQPLVILQALTTLAQQVSMGMPMLPADELGQPLLRRLNDPGFAQDDFTPLRPAAAFVSFGSAEIAASTMGCSRVRSSSPSCSASAVSV